MAKVSPDELEALARKELDKQMAWIEELFGNIRARSNEPAADMLTLLCNLLQNRIAKISDFLDAYEIGYH